MKKLNYLLLSSLFAGVAGLSLTSCSNEDLVSNVPTGNEATVTFNLTTPQINTRDYSDGTKATTLKYAVYKVTKNEADNTTTLTLTGHKATDETINISKQVDFKLVSGHTYGFVFWAGNAEAPYSVEFGQNGAVMEIDYNDSAMCANNEKLDAFYTYEEIDVKGDVQKTIKLYRPFAQINVGTNDYEDAIKSGFTPAYSHVKVDKVYKTLDLVTGEVRNPIDDGHDFKDAPLPVTLDATKSPMATGEKFPVSGYDYMAMVYALVEEKENDQPVVEVKFSVADATGNERAAEYTVGSVPVKRNYRTNIYGELLTSNIDVNVLIEPAYNEPDYPAYEENYGYYEYLKMASQLGGYITLPGDVVIPEGEQILFTKGATLDLDGHTISGTGEVLIVAKGEDTQLVITGDGTISGKVVVKTRQADEENILVWAQDDATITILNGTFEAVDGKALYAGVKDDSGNVKGGTIYVKGGTFNGTSKKLLDCEDDDSANIYVSGGIYPDTFNPEGFLTDDSKSKQLEDGRHVVVGPNEAYAEFNEEKGIVECLVPALPEDVTEEDFETNGKAGVYVNDQGEPVFFDQSGAAIENALKNAKEIYFAPNSIIEPKKSHLIIQQQGITIHGNGATLSGSGEWDFSFQSYAPDAPNYPKYDVGSTMDINIYDLNNVKVWGSNSTDMTININVKNCTYKGNSGKSGDMIMARGADASPLNVNIRYEDCYVEDALDGIHCTYGGTILVNNCTFKNVSLPINIAKKLDDNKMDISVTNCKFINCGVTPNDPNISAWNYAAPIRVVDNSKTQYSVTLKVDNCTINGTKSNWDVLLIDYRDTKEWVKVKYEITNSGDLKVLDDVLPDGKYF